MSHCSLLRQSNVDLRNILKHKPNCFEKTNIRYGMNLLLNEKFIDFQLTCRVLILGLHRLSVPEKQFRFLDVKIVLNILPQQLLKILCKNFLKI
jgi:hypothetical protein